MTEALKEHFETVYFNLLAISSECETPEQMQAYDSAFQEVQELQVKMKTLDKDNG